MHPGYFFDFPRESFVVLSLLPPEQEFAAGLARVLERAEPRGSGMSALMTVRRSGLLLPLFSCPTTTSWGIGDIGSVRPVTRWLAGAGQRALQLLPLSEMAADEQSPYSAISAMAIDPIYIDVRDLPDFAAIGGEDALDPGDRDALAHLRAARRVEYPLVRRLKRLALASGVRAVRGGRVAPGHRARRRARAFIAAEGVVAEGLRAVPRAARGASRSAVDRRGRTLLRDRDPAALEQTRDRLGGRVLFHQYLQWIADRSGKPRGRRHAPMASRCWAISRSWSTATVRTSGRGSSTSISTCRLGCRPTRSAPRGRTGACRCTAGTWSRRTISHGCASGRAERASLFDGYRDRSPGGLLPHLRAPANRRRAVFHAGRPNPTSSRSGSACSTCFASAGAEVIAEDLGMVPDFVRASLERLGVPGFRVFRWERYWNEAGQPFRDPADYPAVSVAISGTHDTETLAAWWDQAPGDERRLVGQLPSVGQKTGETDLSRRPFDPIMRDAIIESLLASSSNLVLLAFQDVFGWRDRINEPATVSADNWTFRLPWPADRLNESAEASERQQSLQRWTLEYHRV